MSRVLNTCLMVWKVVKFCISRAVRDDYFTSIIHSNCRCAHRLLLRMFHGITMIYGLTACCKKTRTAENLKTWLGWFAIMVGSWFLVNDWNLCIVCDVYILYMFVITLYSIACLLLCNMIYYPWGYFLFCLIVWHLQIQLCLSCIYIGVIS